VSKIAHFPQNGTPHSAGELLSNPMPRALDCFGCWLREACRPEGALYFYLVYPALKRWAIMSPSRWAGLERCEFEDIESAVSIGY
jgi:hypothetical protein